MQIHMVWSQKFRLTPASSSSSTFSLDVRNAKFAKNLQPEMVRAANGQDIGRAAEVERGGRSKYF